MASKQAAPGAAKPQQSHQAKPTLISRIHAAWQGLSKTVLANDLLLAAIIGVVFIAVGVGFGWENNKLVHPNPSTLAHYSLEPHNHLSFMADWDGPDYLDIVAHGYRALIQANFFPLYPLLVKLVNQVISSPLDSALLVTWASLIGAIYFFIKIIKRLYEDADSIEALRALLFFLLFPTGVFLIAVYTEALFSLLALSALYYALQKRWLLAGGLTLLATATHITGLFLLVLIPLTLWEQKVQWRKALTTLVMGSLGIIAYMVYLQFHFHNALAFVSSQKTHGWLNYGGSHLHFLLHQLLTRKLPFLLVVAASVAYWWHKRLSFALYSACFLGILVLGGLGAFGRYTLVAFPAQLMLYDYFRNKRLGYPVALVLTAIFWTYFLLQYAAGYTGG